MNSDNSALRISYAGILRAGEGAVGFLFEAGADGLDGAGQEGVVGGVGVEEGEASLNSGELAEHCGVGLMD